MTKAKNANITSLLDLPATANLAAFSSSPASGSYGYHVLWASEKSPSLSTADNPISEVS